MSFQTTIDFPGVPAGETLELSDDNNYYGTTNVTFWMARDVVESDPTRFAATTLDATPGPIGSIAIPAAGSKMTFQQLRDLLVRQAVDGTVTDFTIGPVTISEVL